MLTILGQQGSRFCDGQSRRSFLKVGAMALGGLSMSQIMKAQRASAESINSGGAKPRAAGGLGHKSVIMIFLPGGPPHQDMWDIKNDAPINIRGEFNSIKTNVPGIEIGESFPRIAAMADKFSFLRSVVGCKDRHDAFQCLTGRTNDGAPPGGWPCMGSVVSALQGPVVPAVPPAFGLSLPMGHKEWADNGSPGFLGPAHSPITPGTGEIMDNMILRDVSLDRLRDRNAMLRSFDRIRRDIDTSRTMEGMDAFQQQALGVLTSSKLAEALDINKADPKLRDRYGRGTEKRRDDGGPELLDQFLIARQLVEAGARCVTLGFNRWDWHGGNFKQARVVFPMLDQGVSALVEDLHQRGLDKDVSVIVWGEFGRTPTINKDAGRDHWPHVSCALMAGGGMKHGQIIGSTDRLGGEAKDRPVHFQEIFATLYDRLGINVETVTINDLGGRPRYLIDPQYKVMKELV